MDKAAITLRATNAAIALAGKKRTITLLSNEVSKDLVPKLAAAKEIEPALLLRAKDLKAKLKEAKVLFDTQAEELHGLYTYLQEEHADETAEAKLAGIDAACTSYAEAYNVAYAELVTWNDKLAPKETATPAATAGGHSHKPWKARDDYKPSKLHSTDPPTILDVWTSKAKSYAPGIDDQPWNDRYNLFEDLIAEDVKTAVGFKLKGSEMSIFGKGSLTEILEDHWKFLYPLNRLRIDAFAATSGADEDWYSWESRHADMAAKAEVLGMSVKEAIDMVTINGYKGPYSEKIVSELAKARIGEKKVEMTLAAARAIYTAERYAATSSQASSVKKVTDNPKGRGKSNSNGNGNGSKNQGQPNGKKERLQLSDHPHVKAMKAQKRCHSCYKQGCPGAKEKTPCPDKTNLTCTYCQSINKNHKNHAAQACSRKWNSENNLGSSLRQLMNTGELGQGQSE